MRIPNNNSTMKKEQVRKKSFKMKSALQCSVQ